MNCGRPSIFVSSIFRSCDCPARIVNMKEEILRKDSELERLLRILPKDHETVCSENEALRAENEQSKREIEGARNWIKEHLKYCNNR